MRLTHPARRYLSSQAARPTGAFGRLLGRIWRAETADVNRIAVELLAPGPGERVCEIGFGPGRTLGLLAAAGAQVSGVEVSTTMIAIAAHHNAKAIAAGLISLYHGDGVTLPVADHSLDKVLGVHNFYFWPDPRASLCDIARALRPGVDSSLHRYPMTNHWRPVSIPRSIACPTLDTAAWLGAAGFIDVGIKRSADHPATVWFTATAT